MSDQLVERLSALGVTNKTRAGHALLRAVELGYITELRCEMPQCKRGDDRRGDFDPPARPLPEWMWSVEHIVPKGEGGRLTPDNVILAHRKCNQDDAVNRGRPFRVVTWNMGLARESRGRPWVHDQAWHYLLALGPDLAFVQEALPPAWVRSEGAIVQGPFRQWGSAIFSPRFPLEPFRLAIESPLRSLGSYLAFGTVLLPNGSEHLVASVHAVVKPATRDQVRSLGAVEASRPSIGHTMVNDFVFAGLEQLVQGRRFLVAGDWNVARSVDERYPGSPGSEFFSRTEERGWFECLPEGGQEVQTWFGRGAPYQDDHAFCDPELGGHLSKVRVAAEAAMDLRLSHHAPLIIEFDIRTVTDRS